MLELLFFIALFFLIAVVFYKQRRDDLQILQMEYEQVPEQLTDLLEEQQLLVIRGVPQPKGLTQDSLQKIPRLGHFSVGGQPLSSVLQAPDMLASANGLPALSEADSEVLANELSIPIWANKLWKTPLNECFWFGSTLGTLKTSAILGGLGLFRTSAYTTLFFPTENTYKVSILSRESEDFLPTAWEYRYISSFTANDTPLVADLKFLDIVVRPGTALSIPRHTIVSIEPSAVTQFSAAVFLEYHLPVSLLVKSFS